jgi:hypothetical protein
VIPKQLSQEDLIISKLFWATDSHSELQLGDVRNLLATGYDTAATLDARTETGYLAARVPRMTDTAPEIERMVRDKIMARSGEERFLIGADVRKRPRNGESLLATRFVGGGTATAIVQTHRREQN